MTMRIWVKYKQGEEKFISLQWFLLVITFFFSSIAIGLTKSNRIKFFIPKLFDIHFYCMEKEEKLFHILYISSTSCEIKRNLCGKLKLWIMHPELPEKPYQMNLKSLYLRHLSSLDLVLCLPTFFYPHL